MPTIPNTVRKVSSSGEQDVYIVEWLQVRNGDTCLPFAGPGWADRNVQIVGTPGAGYHAKFEGSNAGDPNATPPDTPETAEYAFLTEGGSVIDMTAVGWAIFDIVPLWIRPVITGDVTTLVDVRMLARKTR